MAGSRGGFFSIAKITMPKAQRKTTPLDTTPEPSGPQFHVLPPPAPPSPNPFGDDPLAAVAPTTARKGAKVYPHATLTDSQRRQLDELMNQKRQAKDLEGTIKALTAQLQPVIVDQYIDLAAGRADAPSSIVATGFQHSALVPVCGDSGGRYTEMPKENAGQLVTLLGSQAVLDNFADGTSLKIKLADVPESKRQGVVADLLAIFQKHAVMDCVERKAIIIPKPEFRAGRWTRFDAHTNRAINAVIPLITSFRDYSAHQP